MRQRFDIVDRLWKRTAGTLSGGEQQFITVCRGFCLNPRVLLLDEVSQGVAPTAAVPLIELVVEYVRNGGIAVVAEQNLRIATDLVTQTDGEVCILESGTACAADSQEVHDASLSVTRWLGCLITQTSNVVAELSRASK